MNTTQLILIGNGMATNRILEALGTEHPFDAIHVFSDEHCAHYNRIMLSPLLAQETTLGDITPHDDHWYQARRIQVHLNQPVQRVDTEQQQVITQDGEAFDYQQLVFATGSRSAMPPLPGTEANNVLGFRGMADVDQMLDSLPDIQHATVIGAGLLGVEAAVGLKAHGLDVTLMHRNPVLMNRQLDAQGSGILTDELVKRGIEVLTGVNPNALTLDTGHNACAVEFTERQTQQSTQQQTHQRPTGMVVFATGILPNRELAEQAGLNVDRGICVNAHMQTSALNVFALGECCQYEHHTYGLVAPIWDQADVVARQLLQQQPQQPQQQPQQQQQQQQPQPQQQPQQQQPLSSPYREREHLTKLKVSGVDIHSLGRFNPTPDADPRTGQLDEVLTLEDLNNGVYKKLIINNQRIQGALCIGDVMDSGWYYELMTQQTDIGPYRDYLLLGQRWVNQIVAA